MKTYLDLLPIELKQQVYELARPQCACCGIQYSKQYKNHITKNCNCFICESCILEKLWTKTGCDMVGERDSFLCSDFCFNTIVVEITE